MLPSLHPPLGRLGIGERFNRTLHGRSRFHPEDVPGHNVFYGYSRPGWGDALDLLCPGGTPVYALEACRQVLHRNDATRLEVITLQGAGFLVVMAHINAVWAGRGHRFRRGDVVGHMRGDLADPHLHLEIARGHPGKAEPIVGRTPEEFARQLAELLSPPPARVVDVRTGDVLGEVAGPDEIARRFPRYELVPGGDHRADQGKLYVKKASS